MFWRARLDFKVIGGFMAVACITFLVGFIGWWKTTHVEAIEQRVEHLAQIQLQLMQREIDHLNWAIKVGEFQRQEDMTELAVQKDDHQCGFGKWYYSDERRKTEEAIPEIRPILAQLEAPHQRLHESARKLETILKKGRESRHEAMSLFEKETLPELARVQSLLGELRQHVQAYIAGVQQEANEELARTRLVSLSGMVVGPLVALLLGSLLTIAITRPLRRVISGLTETTDQLVDASDQIAAGSQQLADGASQQASALQETSSALEQMASLTRQNAQNAQETNRLMIDSGSLIRSASQSMANLTASMGEMSRASEETQKVIRTIDEIAFQTNLLALNAAVEAARAGEAGAGFAVVADEVRRLAIRASEAARSTADLIEDTVRTINAGEEMMDRSNREFSQVAVSVVKAGELVGEITAASHEQAGGIEQVSRAVVEMDKVTERNAANAEESAAASEQMNAQAGQMKTFVGELTALMQGKDDHLGIERSAGADEPRAREVYPTSESWRVSARVNGGNGKAHPLVDSMADSSGLPQPALKADCGPGIPGSGRADSLK